MKKWRDQFENKISKKTGSGKTRILKTKGIVKEMIAVIIKDNKEINEALKDGWMDIFKQGRNSNGKPRLPKYQLNLAKTPQKNIIKLD